MASKKILYASIDGDVHEDLKAIAELAGISVAVTTEAIISGFSGRTHKFTQQVARAQKIWKANKR